MPINIVQVKKNSILEESVITESIPTDSSITESSLDKEQKKTKTQSRKKGTKSVKLSPIEEEILAIQQKISLNQDIASETQDVGKKKETKSAELAPITEEIATIQEISPETVIPEPVPVIESQPAQAKKKKTKKAKVSPENLVPENPVPENSLENPSENSPESQTQDKAEPEQKSPIFQAFGLVKGKILEQGSSYVLQIEDKTYPLFGSRGRIKSFVGSEEEVYLRLCRHKKKIGHDVKLCNKKSKNE